MCADQPADARAREHRRGERRRDLGDVEDDRRPELDVGGEHPVGLARLQLLERDPLELLGDLVARRAELLAGAASAAVQRGSSARYTRWPKPIIRSPLSSSSDHVVADRPLAATASSIGSTCAGAPPCSGPESVPTAADSAAPQSAPVDAAIRAVNVDALRPCSAVQIQYVSIAVTCRGSASPRHSSRNRSAAVAPLRDDLAGTTSVLPSATRADRATIDMIAAESRREILLRLLVLDVDQLPQLPRARESRGLDLEIGGPSPVSRSRVDAPASGMPGSSASSTSSPQTFSYGTRRRAPRCRRRDSEARRRRGRAPRSRSRTRRRPRDPA